MGKLVITEHKDRLLSVLFDEKRPYLIECPSKPSQEEILGNIYLARVKDVIPGIHGAFLAISEKETVFLPLSDKQELLVASRTLAEGEQIRQGDEIVVQIIKEALKTKQPMACGALTLTGQYCVCSYFGHGLSFSKKLKPAKKAALEEKIREDTLLGRKKYKFTIRTNAGDLTDYEPLLQEMHTFIRKFDELTEMYRHRTIYSCLYQSETEILKCIQNIPLHAYDEIVTDVEEVFEVLKREAVMVSNAAAKSQVVNAFENRTTYLYHDKKLRFYRDEVLSLSKLYSIETHLTEALSGKVWLPCGGYLIIEPTEAMIVIDVNSGKTEHKDKRNENYIIKVNLEAAEEIARQLRLRNYSGMIMVDFINMEKQEDEQKVMQHLDACLKEDKVPTRLVDMTALGIVEITRKKVRKPLADFF